MVATATLAILLVCFAIYQSSQLQGDTAPKVMIQRFPDDPLDPMEPRDGTTALTPPGTGGVRINNMSIGGGRDVSLSLYRPGETSPFGEIAFSRWEPVAGSPDELLVVRPEIRLRTKNGHDIRVTAQRAMLEGELRAGFNLKRGRLKGDVLIEYDRVAREDRAMRSKEPGDSADAIDPDQIVRIEIDEVEFDLEYSKVSVPRGGVHLTASDVDFSAGNMEIRFNDEEGRVEYMRISNGGTIELRELSDELGMSFSGLTPDSASRFSLAGWLRKTLQSSVEARRIAKAEQATTVPPSQTSNAPPVFSLKDEEEDRASRTLRYIARFNDNVDVTRWIGERAISRLRADSLEVFRAITDRDRSRAGSKSTSAPQLVDDSTPKPPDAKERVYMQWEGLLVVEAVQPDDERWPEHSKGRVVATGAPVTVSSPQGNAACARLTLETDGSEVWLAGTEDAPVKVRSADQGEMIARKIYIRRDGDKLSILATGPGTLARAADGEDAGPVTSEDGSQQPLTIAFMDKLDVQGRFVTRRRIDFTGRITSKEYRIVDVASFFGQVALRQGETDLDADVLIVEFGPAARQFGRRQTLDRVSARGDVAMRQGRDRVTAGRIDLLLTTDSEGRVVPLTATALTNVEAVQGDRIIRARDKLIVDFEIVSRAPPPFDPLKAHAKALKAGLDVTKIDWEARRKEHESKERRAIGARRLRAFGAVTVRDPAQNLEVDAHEFDCTIADGTRIETALVTGLQHSPLPDGDPGEPVRANTTDPAEIPRTENQFPKTGISLDSQPASVRLDTFAVSGNRIILDVPNQHAEVPGAGRLTFRSKKDLDGRKVKNPIPIVVEWQDRMKYSGRENRAVFSGGVHAYSETTTQFDCRQLLVEFDDVPTNSADANDGPDWWIFQGLADRVGRAGPDRTASLTGERFSKQPAYLLATGNAVALTAETYPLTGKLKSRARLAGPKLSVNLRSDVSKMLIEGHGTLLLEDYPAGEIHARKDARAGSGLFDIDDNTGPSNTLIEWHEFMSYDFSVDQTRFEGDVVLKHFSGSELERLRKGSAGAGPGRSTYLSCKVLTVDFLDRAERSYKTRERRMGRLSAARLRQFQASGNTVIQDKTEGLNISADRVVFERDRNILAIYGRPGTPARIVVQRPNQLPTHINTQRMFYDLKTGRIDASGVRITGR